MPSYFKQVIEHFKKLPGIGQKSAERITFYLLKLPKEEITTFLEVINDFKKHTIICEICGLISEQNPCRICSSYKRNRSIICIVKSIQDAIVIERSGSYFGLYHVLDGLISPINGTYEEDLNISKIEVRISKEIKEIIFALEQNIEAEATIKLISEKIKRSNSHKIIFSRMATGIPMGIGIEQIDEHTLKQSLLNRYSIK